MSGSGAPMQKFLLNALKLVLVAGLMWLVIANVDWRDAVVHVDAEGEVVATETGTVVGDWKLAEVRFRSDGTDEVRVIVRGSTTPEGHTVRVENGFWTYWRNMRLGWFVIGALCYFASAMMAGVRWWWLMHCNGLGISVWNALRFTWIGLFFNNVVPGQTGGDLVKAVYAMRACPGQRVPALVSVVVDRVLGLASLALLGGITVLFALTRFRELAVGIWLVILGVVALGIIAFSRRVRGAIRLNALLERLPARASGLLKTVDQAVFFYRNHKVGIALWLLVGMANHVVSVTAVLCMGHALGIELAGLEYFILIPVINILSAVPLAPGGWGVGEALYGTLFQRYGPGATEGVALSVLFRLHMALWSLFGGVLVLLGKRVTAADVEREVAAELREAEEQDPAAPKP